MKSNYQTWLQEKGLSANTIHLYLKLISYYKQSLTTANISQFLQKITKKLSPPTCQLYLAGLVSYSKFLKIQEAIDWVKLQNLIPHQTQ